MDEQQEQVNPDIDGQALRYLSTAEKYITEARSKFNTAVESGKAEKYEEALELGSEAIDLMDQAESYISYAKQQQKQEIENQFRKAQRAWFIGLGEVNHREDEDKSYVTMGQVQLFLTREDAERGLGKIGFDAGNSIGGFCDSKLNYVWGEASVTPLED